MDQLFAQDLPGSVQVEKGVVLAKQGERGDTLYFLLRGTAAVTVAGKKPQPLQPGAFFGEQAMLLGLPYPATLVALTPLTALALTRDSLGELFTSAPEAGRALLQFLYFQQPPAGVAAPKPPPPPEVPPAPELEPEPEPEPPQSAAPLLIQDDLFPEGHGVYDLELDNGSTLLYQKNLTCPMCKNAFKTLAVRASKLVAERTDDDMRVHYAGIEPLHYDVVTCPQCWYSALSEQFEEADRRPSQAFFDEMQRFQDSLPLNFAAPPDSVAVFASYYLALHSAPLCFYRHESILSRLWVKLSRLYEDCGDTAMWRVCCERALESYLYLFEKTDVPPAQLQQVCYMLGELNYRLGNRSAARRHFFDAKTDPLGSPAIKRMADRRISFIMDDLQSQGDKV